ncbi:MAG: response regulator [Pseudomonadota bacterium]
MVEPPQHQTEIVLAVRERYLARVLMRGLSAPDRTVTRVTSGKAVLERLPSRVPHVLVVDLDLALMSGEELCRRVQAQMPERPFLTVVLASGAEDQYGHFSQWFSQFRLLEKPISLNALNALIEEHLTEAVE